MYRRALKCSNASKQQHLMFLMFNICVCFLTAVRSSAVVYKYNVTMHALYILLLMSSLAENMIGSSKAYLAHMEQYVYENP